MIYGDYIDAPASPLFPFGFGLGYTSFQYSDLVVEPAFEVSVSVTNTGSRPGIDVVQVFARDEVARVARPERQLVGFVRVALEAGVCRRIRFTVDPTVFAYYDEAMRLVVEPGAVRFVVGDLDAMATIDDPEREIAPNDRCPTQVEIT